MSNDIKKYRQLIESIYSEIYIYNDGGDADGYVTDTASEKLENWVNVRHKLNNDEFIGHVKSSFETISFLNNMNVDENSRGQGFGSDLLEKFIDEAANRMAEAIILFADTEEEQEEGFDLIQFYESYDFEVVKKYPDGALMLLSL